MKKVFALMFCSVALAGSIGCSHVAATNRLNNMRFQDAPRNEVFHINSQIYGVYLFGVLPIFSGSANAADKTSVFTDTVRLDYATLLATAAARELQATRLKDINSRIDSHMIFPFFFLSYKSVEVNVTAVK
ncbi:MAG: hypothetical protein PHI56_05765 [Victivallaceae bacterium]|nr:hypothetical protein [Victivallaceae bacterium]MDD5663786.1 hypothetical protein [Victivallaceae bacterium]